MKKIILICSILVCDVALFTSPVNATQVSSVIMSNESRLPDDAKPITVFKVVQVAGNKWSSSHKDAHYSKSENRIYITEGRRVNQPYTVYENRAYGQSNDGRAEYRYTAGGYFFNL